MMKAGFVLIMAIALPAALSAWAEENPWETRPELKQLHKIASLMMDEYAFWSEEYRESGRSPNPADKTVNHMTEQLFCELLGALGQTPNAALQRRCLLFVGETVPTEFDSTWSFILLELDANLDPSVSREVGEVLKKKGLPALQARSIKPRQ